MPSKTLKILLSVALVVLCFSVATSAKKKHPKHHLYEDQNELKLTSEKVLTGIAKGSHLGDALFDAEGLKLSSRGFELLNEKEANAEPQTSKSEEAKANALNLLQTDSRIQLGSVENSNIDFEAAKKEHEKRAQSEKTKPEDEMMRGVWVEMIEEQKNEKKIKEAAMKIAKKTAKKTAKATAKATAEATAKMEAKAAAKAAAKKEAVRMAKETANVVAQETAKVTAKIAKAAAKKEAIRIAQETANAVAQENSKETAKMAKETAKLTAKAAAVEATNVMARKTVEETAKNTAETAANLPTKDTVQVIVGETPNVVATESVVATAKNTANAVPKTTEMKAPVVATESVGATAKNTANVAPKTTEMKSPLESIKEQTEVIIAKTHVSNKGKEEIAKETGLRGGLKVLILGTLTILFLFLGMKVIQRLTRKDKSQKLDEETVPLNTEFYSVSS